MAKPNKASQEKKRRERAQRERQQEKEAGRALRKDGKQERADLIAQGIDPDLVGIVPGPQPKEE